MPDALSGIMNNLPAALTTLTFMALAISFYEARDGFFLFGGQFRGKFAAVTIVVGSVIALSYAAPALQQFWAGIISGVSKTRILGVLLLLGMLAANSEAEWNHVGWKSGIVYLLGLVLIFQPNVLSSVA